jgi:CO/xanthine dehydrogenase FAD-binding subunit
MRLRLAQPGTLVDLSGIAELKGIKKEGEALVIGAMTRHAEVAESAAVKSAIPVLAALAHGIGDRQVRNMGTLGGSIANNDPAADWPAAVLALGATVVTNKRRIAADDFFKGMYETALAADEVITAVSFPIPKKAAYVKFPNPRPVRVGRRVRCADRERRSRGRDRRRAFGVPVEAARRCARQELHGGCREGGEDRLEGAQRRSARLARLSRAPDPGARVARGGGRRLKLQTLHVLLHACCTLTASGIGRARTCPRRGACLPRSTRRAAS